MASLKNRKVVKVLFHVGTNIGPKIENSAAAGSKTVKMVEYIPGEGVIVKSNIGLRQFENFIPLSNITCIEFIPEEEPKQEK